MERSGKWHRGEEWGQTGGGGGGGSGGGGSSSGGFSVPPEEGGGGGFQELPPPRTAPPRQRKLQKEENLRAAFKHFDTNGDGIISREELNNAIGSGGLDVSKEEIDRVLAEVDKDGNGEIDYDEFVDMLTTLAQPKVMGLTSRSSVTRGELNAYKAARSMMT